MKKLMLFAVCSSLILSSCFESGKKESKNENQESKEEDKSELCVIKNVDDDVSQCEDGQLLVFLPNSWGNDQLPIEVAALYCDFDHSVVYKTAVLFVSLIKRDGKSL